LLLFRASISGLTALESPISPKAVIPYKLISVLSSFIAAINGSTDSVLDIFHMLLQLLI
jgi:hypothetical protein